MGDVVRCWKIDCRRKKKKTFTKSKKCLNLIRLR